MHGRPTTVAVLFFLMIVPCFAEEVGDLPSSQGQAPDPEAKDESRFGQFSFGLGIGVSDLSKPDVLEPVIEQGVVRITDSEKTKRGLWLETHYLLDRYAFGPYVSHGPYFGMQVADSEDIIKAVSLGYMVSFKRSPIKDKTSKAAFNLGLGLHSTKIKVLGHGIVEDEPLPTGVESVRLRSREDAGVMLMFSVSVY